MESQVDKRREGSVAQSVSTPGVSCSSSPSSTCEVVLVGERSADRGFRGEEQKGLGSVLTGFVGLARSPESAQWRFDQLDCGVDQLSVQWLCVDPTRRACGKTLWIVLSDCNEKFKPGNFQMQCTIHHMGEDY